MLRVAIIGGGIGGLAAARALIVRGITVDVYEQAPRLAEVGAGIAIHPNGVRMLRRLGLGEQVEQLGARWLDPQFRRSDGTLIAPWWPPDLAGHIEIYGMHRADLLQILLDSVPRSVIHPGHRCVRVDDDGVWFANGLRVDADVILGADGIHSSVQQYVTTPPPAIASGWVGYRGLIDADSVQWEPGVMRNFLGPGKHFLIFPVRANRLLNYVGFVPDRGLAVESWSAVGDPAALAREFVGWDATVERVIAQVRSTFWWALYDREPLARWTRGRVTLLGDAAHPMLPHVGQGANQALEDAVALAALLKDADRDSAPRALQVYEHVRRAHTRRVQLSSRQNGARYDAATTNLSERDRQLSNQARDRAWMWNFDAEAEALSAAGSI